MIKRILFCIVFCFSFLLYSCDNNNQNQETINYTITFKDELTNKSTTVAVNEGEKVEKINPSLYEGYTFIGWTLDSDSKTIFDFNTKIDHNIILYAIWEANINTITFDGNGATNGEMVAVTGKTDEIINLPNNSFEKLGYSFLGWSTSKDGNVIFENKDTYQVLPTEECTLYAVWQANTNTILFDGNGATSGTMSQIECKTDAIVSLPINQFEKKDYEFLGWSETADGNAIYTDQDTYKGSTEAIVILYAVWEKVTKDYSYIIEDYIPDIINSSIDMPNRYGDLRLMWSTSNNLTLNNYGVLIKPRSDENLTVYLTVYDQGELFEYEKEVIVKAIEFKPLPSNNLVFGYYSQWNFFGYTEKMLETCDVINLCFGYVTTDFKIDTASILAVLNQVLSVREKGIRVVLSIQGYSTEGTNFSRAAATEEGRKTLAESMLRVVEKYHLDGIDIDWEYPGFNTGTSVSVDKENYTLLCKQISETFKEANEDYLITAAIPGGGNGPYRFDLGNVAKYLDFIHIMTYDLQSGSKASHHTALYESSATLSGCTVASSVETYKNYGVPSNKIVVGLAFYGKRTKATTLNGSASGGYKAITYDVIAKDYLSRLNDDVIYGFDEVAYAPYLIDKTNGYFITYDDERSIKGKCQYAIDNNLGGVMIWEIGEDTSDTLLSAVYDSIKN